MSWIKCSERMPDETQQVLGWGKALGFALVEKGSRGWWLCVDDGDPYISGAYAPTHWHPLPEPPND